MSLSVLRRKNTSRVSQKSLTTVALPQVRRPCFTLSRDHVFRLRKSLADYVDEELLNMETSVFYQRIFILAKNCSLEDVLDKVAPILPENEQATNLDDAQATAENKPPSVNAPAETEDKAEKPNEEDAGLKKHASQLSRSTSQIKFAKLTKKEAKTKTEELRDKDFFTLFSDMLKAVHIRCLQNQLTPDPMCGLFLYMGDHTMLMLEGGEDMIGLFCHELVEIGDIYWQNNRVFQIEDRISELYTNELISRKIPGAFINEKFPPSTPSDEYLMGKQHMIIKEKLMTICSMISESLKSSEKVEEEEKLEEEEEESNVDTEGEEEEESSEESVKEKPTEQLKKSVSKLRHTLPVDIYRKLLPEIQRIDLVLASTRFYYTLLEFSNVYGSTPWGPDNDGLFWPIQNNYTPPNIFRRTPYDINLTFPSYAASVIKGEEASKGSDEAQEGTAA